jgi:hypothetical protein
MEKENNKDIIGTDLESLAINVVDMFDQANTNNAVENLGTRGSILKEAVAELRFKINSEEQKTILKGDQVGENVTEIVARERHWVRR